MSHETLSVYRIPTPASEDDVTKYSRIRLAALLSSPEAFSSTFADASLFTYEQWQKIVNTPGRTTLLARGVTTKGMALQYEQWGTLTVLHPEMLKTMPDAYPRVPRVADALAQGELELYMLVGMWVHPSARRKGVGRMLVQVALDFIDAEPLSPSLQKSEVSESQRRKIVVLAVHTSNYPAKALYAGMGFMEAGVEDDEQRSTMIVMR